MSSLKGYGFKNNPLRQAYDAEVANLKQYANDLSKQGPNEDEVAEMVNQARRILV